jgi:hypothetical protein
MTFILAAGHAMLPKSLLPTEDPDTHGSVPSAVQAGRLAARAPICNGAKTPGPAKPE